MKNKWVYVAAATIVVFVSVLFYPKGNKHELCRKSDGAVCAIHVEGHRLDLRVAYSMEAQERGLMWVSELGDGEGMIFVYDSPRFLSFWMKNTVIPLSIAFVEADGRISTIHDMYPQPGKSDAELPSYPSATMVKYAVEVPLGWFRSRGIRENSYVKLPEQLR